MEDKGLIHFIKRKLEAGMPLKDIKDSLISAGFSEKQIKEGIVTVKKVFKDTHQDIVASNNFLPPLNKKKQIAAPTFIHSVEAHLFSGRIKRRDFIIGFLFFFGLAVVLSAIAATIMQHLWPDVYQSILEIGQDTTDPRWIIFIPLLLAPITIMVLSLAARRLHDIDLPGQLSLVLLGYFLPSSDIIHPASSLGLYFVASILFIILLTKSGVNHTNAHGKVLDHKGSLFARIFNLV
jgi:uncharacterized membrane protein YhaH (DUF805 family)